MPGTRGMRGITCSKSAGQRTGKANMKMPDLITEARHFFTAAFRRSYFGDNASRTSFTLALGTAGAALPHVLRT
jgi:hypothetical protein